MERDGELAMATGSLTTRWSYPMAEVTKHDLQQSRVGKEESKQASASSSSSSADDINK